MAERTRQLLISLKPSLKRDSSGVACSCLPLDLGDLALVSADPIEHLRRANEASRPEQPAGECEVFGGEILFPVTGGAQKRVLANQGCAVTNRAELAGTARDQRLGSRKSSRALPVQIVAEGFRAAISKNGL